MSFGCAPQVRAAYLHMTASAARPLHLELRTHQV